MKTRFLTLLALAGLVAGGIGLAAAQDKGKDQVGAASEAKSDDAAVIAAQKPSYPLTKCPVSGEPLGSMGDPIDFVVDGHLIRLCCAGCKKGVAAKKDEIVSRIEAAVIAEQKPMWPTALNTCPVSGEAFVEADAVDFVYGTRYVKLCCNGCKKGVTKSPEQVLAKIDAALIEQQKKDYPLTTCVVSGEPIDPEDAVDELYGVTLVRLCCKGCKKGFAKNPESFVAKVKAARATKS